MTSLRSILILVSTVIAVTFFSSCSSERPFDLVIENGRVIDPETAFDDIANVGIRDGKILAITRESLNGTKTIDARGLVVAPGFIDVHSHTPTPLGQELNLADGITTQLDLEAGAFPVGAYGEHFAKGAQINYGASVGHAYIRTQVIAKVDQSYLLKGFEVNAPEVSAFVQPATPEQIEQMRELLFKGLDAGGLGVGVLLDYMTSAVSKDELSMLFEVAAARDVPIYVHVRRGIAGDPAGLIEVIELAEKTNAPLMVCHITHNAMGGIEQWLTLIDEANARGARITTETLSYLAGGTMISADVFSRRDWRTIFDIDYGDVQWVDTGEWLTKEAWDKYAKEKPTGMINHHYVKDKWLVSALLWPKMMVSTDALPVFDRTAPSNPNVSGSFALVLGEFVRERNVLTLNEALTRMTLNQAQWLEIASPAFAKKGRIQLGMDADITLFNPDTVQANADYGKPYLKSTGIDYVIVAGQLVIENGEAINDVYPGQRILNTRVK